MRARKGECVWGIKVDTQKHIMFLYIELDLNGGVKPFWPIKGQDTKLGGCNLAFSHITCTFVQGRGLNSESC